MGDAERGLVGFDATPLEVARGSGVSRYTQHLLTALALRRTEWRYALLASRPLHATLPAGTLGRVGSGFPSRWLWMQLILPRIIAALRPRICHFTNSVAPLQRSCPTVLTIHDMSLFLHPALQPRKSLWLVRTLLPALARRADAIICVSESARRDILEVLELPQDKVRVIHEAAPPEYRVIEERAMLSATAGKYSLGDPFILFVGTIEPRKNLSRLVEAFSVARRSGRREMLVLAGQLGWKYRDLFRRIETLNLRDSVVHLGYVPSEDLPGLCNLARALVFPSLYEGFGLPILEAMSCGLPVLTSNCSSMPEVAGDAALLADPGSTEALASGIVRILSDDGLREELRRRGLARAREFSWQRAADETAAVYREVACSA